MLATLLLALPAQAEVTIDWVTVGDPGNACVPQGGECYGAVAYVYRISKTVVTNAQYAEFLNAVAAADPNRLYRSTFMNCCFRGITRSGRSGSYTYNVIAGRGHTPVNLVSFFDAQRFANWLHNGQPTGAQDATTTEDGAYDFNGAPALGPARKAEGRFFITSEDEWYKAAYYDGPSATYFEYPAGSDVRTICASPGATANTANCENVVADLSVVGSYTGAPSPYGTFDQGGNIWEWNDEAIVVVISERVIRGGSFNSSTAEDLWAFTSESFDPSLESSTWGFRIASPVPATSAAPVPSLSPLGTALLWGLLGLAGWRRLRA